MRDIILRRDACRRCRRWLCVVALTATACTESLPTEAEPPAATVATAAQASAIEDARVTLDDALARVLPNLDADAETATLGEALQQLALRLAGDGRGSAHDELVRAQALLDAHPGAEAPATSAELAALGLALSVAQRALADQPRP